MQPQVRKQQGETLMQFSGENSIEEALMQPQMGNSRELALMQFAKDNAINEVHMQVDSMMKIEKYH